MATNRFQGVLSTRPERNEMMIYGLYAGVMNDLAVRGELSEAGAGSDVGANEDYSSTATFFSYIATENMVVNKLVFTMSQGSVDETTAKDLNLFLDGATALTNGIDFQVRDTDDTVLFSLDPVVTIEGFANELGADVMRNLVIESATNAANTDGVIVTLDFSKIFGAGIRLRNTDKIGFVLNDDFSGLTRVVGSIYGRKIFD